MKKYFLSLLIASSFFASCKKNVDTPTQQLFPGTPGFIYALTTYNNELIVGGNFSSVGDITAHNVAQWNGTTWSEIGNLANGDSISYLINNNGNLIAKGFSGSIYDWNGSSWKTIFSDSDLFPNVVVSYNGNLIIGGYSSPNSPSIEQWNGTTWSGIGTVKSGNKFGGFIEVLSAIVYNGNLIVTGFFDSINGVCAHNVAQYNGTKWSPLSVTDSLFMTETIHSICVYNSEMLVGGGFNLLSWNGSTWQQFTPDITNNVVKMTTYNNDLIASDSLHDINDWNGTNWTNISFSSSPVIKDNWVYAMQVYNGVLYLCGNFTSVNAAQAYHIAKWDGATWSAVK